MGMDSSFHKNFRQILELMIHCDNDHSVICHYYVVAGGDDDLSSAEYSGDEYVLLKAQIFQRYSYNRRILSD